jgi:hypothetical protein
MAFDSLNSALAAGLAAVTGALAWMTIGRFQDRKDYQDKLTQLMKEATEQHLKQLEKVLLVTAEQGHNAAAYAEAMRSLKEQLGDLKDATSETSDAVNGIVRDVLRDAKLGRRTVSDPTMQSVRDLIERGRR